MVMKRFLLFFSLLTILVWADAAGAGRPDKYAPRLVRIETEAEIDSLASEGVEVLRRRGDIVLCLFPNSGTRAGESFLRPRPIAPTLDKAKEFYDAASIQTGAAVADGVPYTGKGVVVGICDVGIDPLHPTFLDADGKSRIRRVVQYVEQEGIRLELEGDDAYREWKTDNPESYHATHVCGILAGGGAGTPYSGIASDADIVVTVSTLTEVGLLAGVEDIIDYAKEVGKPAVINMSVGGYTGPHDGTSLFSQYLDMCAEDAVIVLSAGNEGANLNTLMADFTPERSSVQFKLGNKAWDQHHMYGATELWSGTSSPLAFSLGVYDADEKRIYRSLEPICLTGGESHTYVWSSRDYSRNAFPFDGELVAIGYVDPENGRHCTSLGYDFDSPKKASGGDWARYMLAVEVFGEPGEDLEVYSDGTYTRLAVFTHECPPTTDRSISDLACGFNIVSVGMYGNRDSVPRSYPELFQDDEVYWVPTRYHAGATVRYSSYGTLRDGRMTPLTVAPGADLMSAVSSHYIETCSFYPRLKLEGAEWVDEGGTSMAAPYVAGYIATWLEAVPDLTSADVIGIISRSNRTDIPDPDDPHNGHGYFDPVEGLRLALQTGGVDLVETPAGSFAPDDFIEVYDVAGIRRYAGAAAGLSGIERGLYVVKTPRGIFKRMMGDR